MDEESVNFGEQGLKKLIGSEIYVTVNTDSNKGTVSFLETKAFEADLCTIGEIIKILYEDNTNFDFPRKDNKGNPDYRAYELNLESIEKENNEIILKGQIKHIDWLNLRKNFEPIPSKVQVYITKIPEKVTGYHDKLS